mgnify:CR=1 FL=1
MRLPLLTTVVALTLAVPALAQQRSLFDQPLGATPAVPVAPAQPTAQAAPPPPAPAPAPQAAPAAPVAQDEVLPARPKKAVRAKPRGPVPARSLTVLNGTPQVLVGLEVSQESKGARLKKPLAPGKKTTLALPAFKGCEVAVASTFEGQPANEPMPVDICKEKSLNFRD